MISELLRCTWHDYRGFAQVGGNPSLGFHPVEASQFRVQVFSMCGSSQRRSLELITAMCLTKRDIFTGRSSGRDGGSSLQALRGHWTSNGHHTALRTTCHSEPSFLWNINSSYTRSHLDNWIPLLFTERPCKQNQVPSLS